MLLTKKSAGTPTGARSPFVHSLQRGLAATIAPIARRRGRSVTSDDVIRAGIVPPGEWPERVRRAWVAPRFLEVWRVAPAMGRGFTEAEHRVGGQAAVLISDRYWRVRLGRDPNVIGRTIRIGSEPPRAPQTSFPIIGVMPASFLFPDRDVDLWFPVATDFKFAQSRLAVWYRGVGRLRPGVTPDQARANLETIQAELARLMQATGLTAATDKMPLDQGVKQDLPDAKIR